MTQQNRIKLVKMGKKHTATHVNKHDGLGHTQLLLLLLLLTFLLFNKKKILHSNVM